MNVIQALESMEAAAQGNARLEALKAADSPELRKVLTLALDPSITFGVKKLPDATNSGKYTYTEWRNDILILLYALAAREITGNAAQDLIGTFLSCCDDVQAKWSERILKQDLRLNLGAKDVNNVFGKNTIYLFEVPLATDYAKVKPKDLAGRWEMQAKLDGGRCVAVLPGDGSPVRLLSRTGKEWGNFESIRLLLQAANKDRRGKTVYLDGEVVSYVNGRIDFQSIQKTMMRRDGVETGELHFVCFDAATEDEWKAPKWEYWQRLNYLTHFLFGLGVDELKVYPIFSVTVTDPTPETLLKASEQFVEKGFEGGMVRRSDLPVVNKRSKTLLKVKSFKDDEAEIIGMVEGTGKLVGMLGALKCRLKSGVEFEIGSGFDEKTRQELWAMNPVGRKTNFKFFELTNDGVPRFPIYRSLRHEDDIG